MLLRPSYVLKLKVRFKPLKWISSNKSGCHIPGSLCSFKWEGKEWSLNSSIYWSHIPLLLQIKSSPGTVPEDVAGYCLCRTCFSPDARFPQQFYSAEALCESKGAGRVGPSRNHHFGKECNCWSEMEYGSLVKSEQVAQAGTAMV